MSLASLDSALRASSREHGFAVLCVRSKLSPVSKLPGGSLEPHSMAH